jgi:predicted kinase
MTTGAATGARQVSASNAEPVLGARLFVLCGLPFAGKSTLARGLTARLGLVHVELDAEHDASGLDLMQRSPTPAEWLTAYRRAYRRLDQVLAEGRAAVFDATSYRRVDRDRLRRMAAARGVPVTLVYLDVPAEEALRRREANRCRPRRPHVPDGDFARIGGQMEPPALDETAIRYDASLSAGEWIERVLLPTMEDQTR